VVHLDAIANGSLRPLGATTVRVGRWDINRSSGTEELDGDGN
jgi:hypothetical protein